MAVKIKSWLYNIFVVNDVVNIGKLAIYNSLGHGEHIYTWFPSYFTVMMINETKFRNPCHALETV